MNLITDKKRPVVLIDCRDYRVDNITKVLQTAVDYLGGFKEYIAPGERVLIKPNLLAAYPPEASVTTHPSVVEAVVRHILYCGGQPFIGDSPAFGDLYDVAEKTGVMAICMKYGIPLIPFSNPVQVSTKDPWLKKIYIDKAVLEADRIINVPKLKTHVQVGFTGAVKNLFGCMPGKRKALWHFKAGDEDFRFGRLLLEIYRVVGPILHVVDGITIMEGNGPAQGIPKSLGLIGVSQDGLFLDRTLCDIIGLQVFSSEIFLTLSRYYNQSIDIREIKILGKPIQAFKGQNILLPSREPIRFDLIRILLSVLKHLKKKVVAK